MATDARDLDADAERFMRLLRALIRQIYALDPEDPTTELPVAQLRVSGLLSEGPRTVSALAKELGISVSAITQVADRLEAAGLVERAVNEEDRRVRTLALTPHGSELTRRRRERRRQSARERLATLQPADRQAVLVALQTLAGPQKEVEVGK